MDSKHQAIIELSAFGSKIFAPRTAVEIVNGMQYKLRMMDVASNGPAYMIGYNMGVVNGASIPQWKISKKHPGICYHDVLEASAAGIWRLGFVKGKYKITDFLTKIISGNVK